MKKRRSYFDMKRHIVSWGLLMALFVLFFGCATQATVKQKSPDKKRQFERDLVETWDQFDIYLFEFDYGNPGCILFDIKNDNKTLRVGTSWKKIKTNQELEELFDRVKIWQVGMIPNMSTISGPDGKDWGYAITTYNPVRATVADERTIDVMPPVKPLDPKGG